MSVAPEILPVGRFAKPRDGAAARSFLAVLRVLFTDRNRRTAHIRTQGERLPVTWRLANVAAGMLLGGAEK